MADPFKVRARMRKASDQTIVAEDTLNDQSSLGDIASEGLKASALGQLLGYKPQHPTMNASMPESLAFKAGALGGDVPTMSAGSVLGGALAGLLGGGPLGAALGAGAGSFGLPEFIKQLSSYVRKEPKKDESLVDKLGSILDIGLQTGKQAIIGAATGGAGRLFPLLKLIPGLSKVAGTRVGQGLIKGGTELAAMTGTQAALEGELPSVREVAENAMLLGAMKGAGAGVRGAKKLLGKEVLPKATAETARTELDIFKKRALELAPKVVGERVERFKKQQPYFDLLRKHIGEKNKRIVDSQFKWRETAEKAQGKTPFTPKQLEEAINYRQKTGNPTVEGDTFEKLKERIPESLKKIVDKDIDSHFKKTLTEINKHPYLRNINPREGLAERYIPGMYENPEKFTQVYDKVAKDLGFKNPFADMKSFIDYNEAFKKAGLVPRYKNIFELMEGYDRSVAKMVAGADLLSEIPKFEKAQDSRLIVTSNDPDAYQEAKASGYIPFDDFILRRYSQDGKLAKRPTVSQALVAPEFADAIKGVFTSKAPMPESKFWKTYDTLGDMARFGRVKLSFFHYVPLTESSAGALGLKKALGFRSLAKQGYELRSNQKFMTDAERHGLIIHKPVERYQRIQKIGERMVDAAIKYLPEKVITKAQNNLVAKGINKLAASQKYLFEQYHPNLKAVTWKEFTDKAFSKMISEGNPPTEAQRTQVKNEMADLVNSMYGGQNWDIQRTFNDKNYRKWLRRVIAYPDWTTSAIRQAAGAFSGGLKGEVSRKYWLKFGINSLLAHGALQFIFGGMKQTDKDKSVSGIRWDPVKALNTVIDPDPIEWYKFPLPDVPVKIAGMEFNPGREAATEWKKTGSKIYSHFGKQALEIKGWGQHPLRTLFNKSNPIISTIWKQVLDTTPADRENFTVRGKWKKGERDRMPWDATEPYTASRLVSRLASVIEDVSPFAMRTLFDKGVAPYVATGLGSVPISKGTTPYKAAPILESAFKKKDIDKVNRIRKALRENGYTEKQIKAAVNSARRRAGS